MTKEILLIGGAGILIWLMMSQSSGDVAPEDFETKRHREHNRRHDPKARTLEQFHPDVTRRRGAGGSRILSNIRGRGGLFNSMSGRFPNISRRFPRPPSGRL